jgi:hypothetical protein
MPFAGTSYPNPSKYWDMLLETLSSVFLRTDAADLLAAIKNEIQKGSSQEQLVFFHKEPLDVAALVIGTNPSASLVTLYLAAAKQLHWTL